MVEEAEHISISMDAQIKAVNPQKKAEFAQIKLTFSRMREHGVG
jgi:hypothetical protein